MAKLSQFNKLFREYVPKVQSRTGLDQTQLGEAIGGTRATIQGGMRIPRALSYSALLKFCELGKLSKADAEDLKTAWFQERMSVVKRGWGAAFAAFVDQVRTRVDDDEFRRMMKVMRDAYVKDQDL